MSSMGSRSVARNVILLQHRPLCIRHAHREPIWERKQDSTTCNRFKKATDTTAATIGVTKHGVYLTLLPEFAKCDLEIHDPTDSILICGGHELFIPYDAALVLLVALIYLSSAKRIDRSSYPTPLSKTDRNALRLPEDEL